MNHTERVQKGTRNQNCDLIVTLPPLTLREVDLLYAFIYKLNSERIFQLSAVLSVIFHYCYMLAFTSAVPFAAHTDF